MKRDIACRRLMGEDADAFAQLRREIAFDNPVPLGLTVDEELSRPLEGFRSQLSYPLPNAAFGAFEDGRLVGSAAVAWPGKFPSSRHKAELWGVFVSPGQRGNGIGRRLVGMALDHAFGAGARRVNLTVYLPNDAAVALYRSLGFVACGTEPEAVCLGGIFHDGLQMSLLRPGGK